MLYLNPSTVNLERHTVTQWWVECLIQFCHRQPVIIRSDSDLHRGVSDEPPSPHLTRQDWADVDGDVLLHSPLLGVYGGEYCGACRMHFPGGAARGQNAAKTFAWCWIQ